MRVRAWRSIRRERYDISSRTCGEEDRNRHGQRHMAKHPGGAGDFAGAGRRGRGLGDAGAGGGPRPDGGQHPVRAGVLRAIGSTQPHPHQDAQNTADCGAPSGSRGGGNYGSEARRGGGVRRVGPGVRRHLPPLQLARRREAPPATCVSRTLSRDRVEPHLRQYGRCRGTEHGGAPDRPPAQGVGRMRRRAGPGRRDAARSRTRPGRRHRATARPDVRRSDVVHCRRRAERRVYDRSPRRISERGPAGAGSHNGGHAATAVGGAGPGRDRAPARAPTSSTTARPCCRAAGRSTIAPAPCGRRW